VALLSVLLVLVAGCGSGGGGNDDDKIKNVSIEGYWLLKTSVQGAPGDEEETVFPIRLFDQLWDELGFISKDIDEDGADEDVLFYEIMSLLDGTANSYIKVVLDDPGTMKATEIFGQIEIEEDFSLKEGVYYYEVEDDRKINYTLEKNVVQYSYNSETEGEIKGTMEFLITGNTATIISEQPGSKSTIEAVKADASIVEGAEGMSGGYIRLPPRLKKELEE
jgi:hypothetical protein